MHVCSRYPCGWNGLHCIAQNCPSNPGGLYAAPPYLSPTPSPRTMPVNIPFSNIGITIVTMDRDGNVTIKIDQVPQAGAVVGTPPENIERK